MEKNKESISDWMTKCTYLVLIGQWQREDSDQRLEDLRVVDTNQRVD